MKVYIWQERPASEVMKSIGGTGCLITWPTVDRAPLIHRMDDCRRERESTSDPGIGGAVGLVMFGGEHGGKPLVTDSGSFSQTSSE